MILQEYIYVFASEHFGLHFSEVELTSRVVSNESVCFGGQGTLGKLLCLRESASAGLGDVEMYI